MLEREGGHDERAARAEDLEQRVDHGLGAALDAAERPKSRVDERDLARAEADLAEAVDEVGAGDGRRGARRQVGGRLGHEITSQSGR